MNPGKNTGEIFKKNAKKKSRKKFMRESRRIPGDISEGIIEWIPGRIPEGIPILPCIATFVGILEKLSGETQSQQKSIREKP